jgi:glucokinase
MTRALAVDLGGSHVACAAVAGKRCLETLTVETDSKGRLINLLPTLAVGLRALIERHGSNFAGIAFGFCGLVDSRTGRVLSTNHKYSDATEIDLPGWARREFGLPLILENDARLALLGERHSGVAQGYDDVVMMTLGTGIGTAVVMGGHLLRGKHSQAGCLGGHFTIISGGRLCSCGAQGCFEAEASTYALPDVCRTWPAFQASRLASATKLDFATLFRYAGEGDEVSREIRERSVHIWSACALSLVHAYDPELLIVGGGVIRSSYPTVAKIQQHVESYAWTPWGKVRVRAATLGSEAALMGAVPLFEEQK